MEKNYSRRDFLKKSIKGLFGLITGIGLLSLTKCKSKLLFDGEIDGQRVVYCNGERFYNYDRMDIYNEAGDLFKIIKDFDGKGIIGDDERDRYIIVINENKKMIYARDFIIDENEIKFKRKDKDSISRKASQIGEQRLNEATKLYRDLKEKIEKKLESKL